LTDVLSAIQAISGYPAEGSLDEGIVEHLDPEPAIGKTKPDHSWRGWSP